MAGVAGAWAQKTIKNSRRLTTSNGTPWPAKISRPYARIGQVRFAGAWPATGGKIIHRSNGRKVECVIIRTVKRCGRFRQMLRNKRARSNIQKFHSFKQTILRSLEHRFPSLRVYRDLRTTDSFKHLCSRILGFPNFPRYKLPSLKLLLTPQNRPELFQRDIPFPIQGPRY